MVVAGRTRRIKKAKASAGEAILTPITSVGWGDGGHDPVTGEVIVPSDTAPQAYGQFLEKEITSIKRDDNVLTIEVSLAFNEGNGRNVSSCAIFDSDGDLVAITNFSPKGKDDKTVIDIDFTEIH